MSKKSNRPQFRLKPACAAVLLAFTVQQATPNPLDPTVVKCSGCGLASFATSGNTLTVTNTPGAIINWRSFSIAANETTHFAQQSASSSVLNRVAPGNPSHILGTLSSTGRVFLVNPGGVIFGQGATVDVAGLVATTLNLGDADFLAGRYNFARVPGAQSISNAGNITAQSGGEIYLIAPDVKNTGVISAPNGEILLAAGHEVELVNSFDPNLRVSITAPAGDATNVGKLVAGSGSLGLFGTVVRNSGTASADSAVSQGGKIVFRASQRAEVGGMIGANGTGGGSVSVSAAHSAEPTMPGVVVQTGSIEANGASGAGGSVSLNGDSILSSAAISVNGAAAGGQISVQAAGRALSTSSARYSANSATGSGGDILVSANVSNYTSGSYSATGAIGGTIILAGNEIKLAGAQLDASGISGGGTIRVGGLMHGAAGFGAQGVALANADNVIANSAARFAADAVQTGNGGEVVLWSDQSMRFSGNISARGGALGGNGGMAEVSGLTSLGYTGLVDLSAPRGAKGTLLLDPYNITIAAGNGALPASPYQEIIDLTPGAGEGFGGFQTRELANGNILITSPNDSLNGSSSGAVYLYDTAGLLLSALVGGTANDRVGNGGITELNSGHYLVYSPNWSGNLGAVTWMHGSSGQLSGGAPGGAVSNTNSLTGSAAGDQVGSGGATWLNGWNYAIRSTLWGSGGIAANARGAVTWINGATGELSNSTLAVPVYGGEVGLTNSLIGSTAGDKVGTMTIRYFYGATTPSDSSGVAVYGGNLIVNSNNWNNGGAAAGAGAVTWMRGATGALSTGATGGAVSSANSLVGSAAGDRVGMVATGASWGALESSGISPLPTGNIMVRSGLWGSAGIATNALGAVTWINGATGELSNSTLAVPVYGGAVGSTNSLIGSTAGDRVGGNFMTLANGNVVVTTSNWTQPAGAGPALANVGAVTWISGATGLLAGGSAGGAISSSNSLVGDAANDRVGNGGIYLVGNGNYLVRSGNWNGNRGAVTWVNGATGISGTVSFANSIVGALAGDMVGAGWTDTFTNDPGLVVLPNGHFVVVSSRWNGGRGAVTWGNGATGTSGIVSGIATTGNALSLVGAVGASYVGAQGIQVQTGGSNFVVKSPWFDFNTLVDNGAVTWMNGTTGAFSNGTFGGAVDGTNSLMGGFSLDNVGAVTALNSGNFMATTPVWNGGSPSTGLGAVTGINGATGWLAGPTSGGVISSANSVLGSSPGDMLGFSIIELANGNVLGITPNWDNGSVQDAGAVTWVNGTTGALSDGTFGGAIGAANSLVGSATGDLSGSTVTQLSGGNLLLRNPGWDNANTLAADAGAVTWMNGSTGKLADLSNGGAIGAANSLVGSATGDMLGSSMIEHYLNLNILLLNPNWDNGGTLNAGAATWMNGATGELSSSTVAAPVYGGAISAANSLLGSLTSDSLGSGGITQLGNGNFVIASPSWNGGRGAATWMNGATGALLGGGTGGIISALNSLVGVFSYDSVGTGIISFSDYSTYWNYVVRSNWGGGVGALTWVNGTTGLTSDSSGTISATNSLVGSIINDTVGAGVANYLSNGNAVFSNQYWSNGRGAVTWMNPSNGRLADGSQGGVISASNSLVGATPDGTFTGDHIGSGGVTQITDYSTFWNYVVLSPNWTNGAATAAGAVTLGNGATGTVGSVTFANSLVGSVANDRVGSGGITAVSDGATFWNYIVRSPDWGGAGGYQTAKGAVTWVNGRTGVLSNGLSGDAVDALNSLIGSLAGDQVGVASFSYDSALNGVNVLSNNNLLIRSQHWNGERSALTWMNGATGRLAGGATGGAVAATNSLLGGAVGDDLGNGYVGVTELQGNGNWVITSPDWGNGGVAANRKGAATWMNGTTGQLADGLFGGVVSASNSLVGSATTPGLLDYFCDCGNTGVAGGVLALSDGNYVVYRQDFSPDVGALTWGNGGSGTVGTVASNNSLLVFANNVQEMSGQPGTVLVGSGAANGGMGGVYLIGAGAGGASGPLFADSPATDATVGASWIAGTLNLGTNLVLQANNDITQDAGAAITATGLGSLTLQAGRSVTLNDAINIAGALAITANDPGADSCCRDLGSAVLDTTLATLTAGQINLANSGGDILAGTMTASTGAISLVASGNISVALAQTITAMAAGMGVTLNADSDGSGDGAIRMNDGSSITSDGGDITLGGGTAGDGSGNAAGNATYIDGIYLTGAVLDAGGGDIALRGTGFAGASSSNGIYVTSDNNGAGTIDSAIRTVGAGTITLNGDGAGGSGLNSNMGIRIGGGTSTPVSGASISSVDGLISLTGQGGASTGSSNMGIYFHNGSTIAATGTGDIMLFGTGGSSGGSGSNRGTRIASGAAITTNSGDISITGIGAWSSDGLQVAGGASVQSATGNVALSGTSGDGSNTDGTWIGEAGTTVTSGGGMTITGTSIATAGSGNHGVVIDMGAKVSATGLMMLNGSAGAGASDAVLLSGAPVGGVVNAATGLSITGMGDVVVDAGSILNVGTGNANISATNNILFAANSSLTPSAGVLNIALYSDSDGAGGGGIYLDTGSSINSNGGSIWMGGAPSVGYAIGNGTTTGGITFYRGIYAGGSLAVGAGSITMRGQGFNAGWEGVRIAGALSTGGPVSIVSAGDARVNDITVTGTGLANAIDIRATGWTYTGAMDAASGSITISGDAGVDLDANDWTPTILAQAGNVSISSSAGDVMASYWANVTGQNVSISAAGLVSDGDASNYGTITANALNVTAGAGINLHTAAGSLTTSNSGTGNTLINNTGALTIVGMSDGGTITLNNAGGAITAGTGTVTANTLDVISAGGIALNTAVGSIHTSNTGAGNTLISNTGALTITGMTETSGSITLNNAGSVAVTGGMSANGATLTTSGIALTASGAASDISITGAGGVNTYSGAISLNAGQDIVHSGGAQQINSSSGTLSLTAGRDILHTGSTTNQINTFSGAMMLMAGRDIVHTDANQINSYSGAMLLMAGRDFAHSGAAGQINNNSGSLAITAGQDFTHSASGQINTNSGALTITTGRDFFHSASGQVNTASGAMTINAGNNFLYTGSGQVNTSSGTQLIAVGGDLTVSGGSSRISSGGGQTIAARDLFVGPAGGRLIAYSGAQNITASRDMSAVMNGGSAYIESQSGLQTITVGRDLLVQVTNSAGGTEAHIEGGAGQVITVGGNLTMNALDNDQTRINANGGDQTITVGGNMTLNAAQDIAHVQSLYGTQTVTVRGNLDLLGSSAYMRGALGQAITVGGNLSSQGGRISSGAATALQVGNDLILAGGQVWSDGPLTGSVGRDVTITGAPYSLAGLFGTPDIGGAASPFSVGGVIRLNDGSTGGGAEIHSGLPYSIWIHFPNLTGGGYFVNGVESAVSGGSSGFYANGLPAVLDSNLHITYRPLAIISQPVLDFIAQSSFTPAVFPVNTLQPPNVNLLLAAAPPGAGEEREQNDPDLAALAAAALGPDPEAPPATLPVCK